MKLRKSPSKGKRSADAEVVFLEDGRPAELPGFDPYFGRWISWLRKNEKSKSTLCTYARAIPRCVVTLQSICGVEVSLEAIANFESSIFEQMQRQMLEEGAAEKTILVRMAALRSFGRFLLQFGASNCHTLVASQLLDLEMLSQPQHTPGKDDRNYLAAILAHQPQDNRWETFRNRAILELLSAHGLTIAEALAIDCEDLSFESRTLCVVGGRRPRNIPLEPQVLEDIAAYAEVCPYEMGEGSPLFRGARGARLVARVVQLAIQELRDQLGLHEETTPRTIRKSRILQLVASGVQITEIMQTFGLSATAMDAILREAPVSPLAIDKILSDVNAIFEKLRSTPRRAITRSRQKHGARK